MEGVFFPKKRARQLWVLVCAVRASWAASAASGLLAGRPRGGNRLVIGKWGREQEVREVPRPPPPVPAEGTAAPALPYAALPGRAGAGELGEGGLGSEGDTSQRAAPAAGPASGELEMVVHPGTLHSPGAGWGGSPQGTAKGCGHVCARTRVSSQVTLARWFGWVLAKQRRLGSWVWAGSWGVCDARHLDVGVGGNLGGPGPTLFTNTSGRAWVS